MGTAQTGLGPCFRSGLDGTSWPWSHISSPCGQGPRCWAFAEGRPGLVLQDGDETTMALKTMPIAKLQDLKSKIEAAINERVSQRRRELEAELSKLARFGGGVKGAKFGRGGPGGPVA